MEGTLRRSISMILLRGTGERLYKQLRCPDGVHSFPAGCGTVEDACYRRRSMSDGHCRAWFTHFELVDGATIKVNITDEGRTPLLLPTSRLADGIPAVDLSDGGAFHFCNVRSHKFTGWSKVGTGHHDVNLALNRQMYQRPR